ncbi:antitoxin [Nonomuraea jiangxiensis]|uniref:MT0933-like antitoxin protein n=1 Tax=Nonomuraea jiangxiensis TaxID=633440 RepID=A0A1G9FZC9_9ACTN|nr:antitoxin [Nonomuraea jiangxiensis]SDK93705.1 MT0933-like antitoxin protein [Nonomuraea jiangxiensis]
MGRIGEWLKKAEHLARSHSKQADQLLDRAQQMAKERTGHKYDEKIEKGADAVQRRYGGGETPPGARPGTRTGQEPPRERREPPPA